MLHKGRAMRRIVKRLLFPLSVLTLISCSAPPLDRSEFEALYQTPPAPPNGPVRVFHLGHSLVGRDMPAMLAQIAPQGHNYESQLGWGTTLKAHWGDEPIKGFDTENTHPRYRGAGEAADSGDYDAFVLTEMVEIRDAIEYFDSAKYLGQWAERVWSARNGTRVYLYETWHQLDSPEGWLERLDLDLTRYWEGEILQRAVSGEKTARPIYVIPAGQVMAKFTREVEARGGVAGIRGREELFALDANGERDNIHINDLGAYLVALTHYAVLYGRDPRGLPHRLRRADGSEADAPSAEAAQLMQEVVWQVVTGYPMTGVRTGRTG